MKSSKASAEKERPLELSEHFAGTPARRKLRVDSRYLSVTLLNLEFPHLNEDNQKNVFMNKNPEYSEFAIGRFSYGHPAVLRYESKGKVVIGSFCSIANGVTILLGGEHHTDWITTYPFNVLIKEFQYFTSNQGSKRDVIIGNDVWIGLNATILSGVKIGDGAVVGADSVVATDVPPYAIVGGNPAKLIRMRFDQKTVDDLLKIKWWNWTLQRIRDNMPLLLSDNVEEFVQRNMKSIGS